MVFTPLEALVFMNYHDYQHITTASNISQINGCLSATVKVLTMATAKATVKHWLFSKQCVLLFVGVVIYRPHSVMAKPNCVKQTKFRVSFRFNKQWAKKQQQTHTHREKNVELKWTKLRRNTENMRRQKFCWIFVCMVVLLWASARTPFN